MLHKMQYCSGRDTNLKACLCAGKDVGILKMCGNYTYWDLAVSIIVISMLDSRANIMLSEEG